MNKNKEQKNFIIHKNIIKTHYQSVVFKDSSKVNPFFSPKEIYSYPLRRFKFFEDEEENEKDYPSPEHQLLSYYNNYQDQRLLMQENDLIIDCRKEITTRNIPESQQRTRRVQLKEKFAAVKTYLNKKRNDPKKNVERGSILNSRPDYMIGASRNFLIAAEENKLKEEPFHHVLKRVPLESMKPIEPPQKLKKVFQSLEKQEKQKLKESIKVSRKRISIKKIAFGDFRRPAESVTIEVWGNKDPFDSPIGNEKDRLSIVRKSYMKQDINSDQHSESSGESNIMENPVEAAWKIFEKNTNPEGKNNYYEKKFASNNGSSPILSPFRSGMSPTRSSFLLKNVAKFREGSPNKRNSEKLFTLYWVGQGKKKRRSLLAGKRNSVLITKDERYAKVCRSLLNLLKKLSRLKISFDEFSNEKIFPSKEFEKEGSYVFFQSIKHGNYKIVSAYLKMSRLFLFQYNQLRQTPLHLAVSTGDFEMIKLLLASEPDVEAEDRDGNTPLFDAIKQGKYNIAKLLLFFKSDPFRRKRPFYSEMTDDQGMQHNLSIAKKANL